MARHVLDVSMFQTLLGKGPTTSIRHYGITVVIWLLTIILAASTPDLGPILEIFGAFGASVSSTGVLATLHGSRALVLGMARVLRGLDDGVVISVTTVQGRTTAALPTWAVLAFVTMRGSPTCY